MTIRVILRDGVGNQLFQYAAGRALALSKGTDLRVDSPIARPTTIKRDSAAAIFQLAAAESALLPALYRKLTAKRRQLKLLDSYTFCETDFSFSSDFFDLPDGTTLFGYFQNEKYFSHFADHIRAELSFHPYPLAPKTKCLLEQINGCEAVSVHVRRGDYVYLKKFNVCTKDYYRSAIERCRNDLTNPKFFFFSDDPDWCAKHYHSDDFTICNLPASRHRTRDDLQLMSACKHNIIANSTFSWWGAWLNHYTDKQVIAPHKWLNGPFDPVDDIVCKNWTKISF